MGTVRAWFRVEDEGYGIPPEDAGRVFEKFYRRGNKETRDESGFGLGLSFVREVAVQHGGDVTLESQPGKGSVFSLWIPSGQKGLDFKHQHEVNGEHEETRRI